MMPESHQNAELWDKIWKKDQIISDYSIRYLSFMTEIERALLAGSTVCEAGCGTGQTLRVFTPRHRTIGLDISANALNLARNNCNAPIQEISSAYLSVMRPAILFITLVIEHFIYPGNVAAVAEMARVTGEAGGSSSSSRTLSASAYKIGKEIAYRMKRFEFGYEEDYSPRRLKTTLEEAGVEVTGYFGLQATPVLATNDKEALSFSIRQKIARIERYYPFREYYSYAVGIVGHKE